MEEKQRQDIIRDKLNNYIQQGRKAKWVASQIPMDESLLSRFRKGTRDLWESTLEDIETFLIKQGEVI